MQDFICYNSVVKGDQRLSSEPFANPSMYLAFMICFFALVCNRCSRDSLMWKRALEKNVAIAKTAFRDSFVDLIKLALRMGVFQLSWTSGLLSACFFQDTRRLRGILKSPFLCSLS